MNKRTVSLAALAILGLALAFVAFHHLTAPKKPPGGWYHGGPYTLTITCSGGISGLTQEWVQISNQPPQTNLSSHSMVQVFVSGGSAGEIAKLLNQHDIDQWGYEAFGAGQDMIYRDAVVTHQGKSYHWTWNTSGLPPPSSLADRIKRMVIKPKHPLPHSREMHQLREDILQVMRNNTNDLTVISLR